MNKRSESYTNNHNGAYYHYVAEMNYGPQGEVYAGRWVVTPAYDPAVSRTAPRKYGQGADMAGWVDKQGSKWRGTTSDGTESTHKTKAAAAAWCMKQAGYTN